jgi:hypothetical protein
MDVLMVSCVSLYTDNRGHMDATMWRKRIKKVWGLPTLQSAGPGRPLKIVIVDRPRQSYSRYFENLPAMEAVLKKYGLPYQVVDLGTIPRVKGMRSLQVCTLSERRA